MIELAFVAEDIRITAQWSDQAEHVHWHVKVYDELSGMEMITGWTYQQLGAVLYLLAGTGEDERTDKELTAVMYSIAEPLFKDWPKELRPIP